LSRADAIAANVLALFRAPTGIRRISVASRDCFRSRKARRLEYLALLLRVGSLLYRSGRLF
jgi:hypothetical protein